MTLHADLPQPLLAVFWTFRHDHECRWKGQDTTRRAGVAPDGTVELTAPRCAETLTELTLIETERYP